MSMGGDPDLNIVQRILLEFDRGSAQDSLGEAGKFVIKKMGEIEEEAGKIRASKAKESVKRYAKAHMEAMEKVAREEIKLVNKTLSFITKTELEEQRRRNEKLATTQQNAWKRRLADNKAMHQEELVQVKGHQKRLTEAAIAGSRIRVNAEKQAEARRTTELREESSKRVKLFTAEVKDRDRVLQTAALKERARNAQEEIRKTSAQKQAERERTLAIQAGQKTRDRIQVAGLRKEQADRDHANRLAEQRDRAHHQRTVAITKSFFSILRTTNETSQRAIVHAWQAHFRRLQADRAHDQATDLAATRRHEDRRLSIFRSSYREQQTIITRSMVRQNGIIASGSQQATRGIVGSFFNMRNLLLGAGGFISARAIFGNLQDYQQTQVAFTNLLGSAERADSLLKDLFAFNQRTPFNLAGVQDAAKRLLAMGETSREILPDLQAIGDVGAKFSATTDDVQGVLRALGQMSQKARVSAQDINQIQERFVGFNAKAAIARGLGISVAEAMEQIESGALSGNEGMNAMIEGMKSEENAAGAMEEQMKTLSGALSNFGDLMLSIQIRVLGPFIDEMANAVKTFTSFIDSLFFGTGVFTVIRSGLLGVAAAAGVLLSLELVKFLQIFLLGLNPVVIGVLALGAGFAILVRHVPAVGEFFKELAGGVADFATEKLADIKDFFVSIGPVVQEAGRLITPVLQDIGTLVTEAFGALLEGDFSGVTDIFTASADKIGEALSAVFDKLSATLEPFVAPVVEFFQNAFAKAEEFIRNGGVDLIVTGFLDLLANVVTRVRSAAGDLFTSDLFKPLLAGVGLFLTASVLGIGLGPLILGAMAAGLLAVSPTARERITDFFSNVFDNVGEFVTQRLPLILLGGLFGIGQFIGGPVVSTILSETGIKIIAGIAAGIAAGAGALLVGLIDGLRRGIPSAVSALTNVVNDLFSSAFDAIDSPLFTPLELALEGILPLLEAVVNLIAKIPTPVIAAAGAIVLLVKAFQALKVLAAARWLLAIPSTIRSIGGEFSAMSRRMATVNQGFASIGSQAPLSFRAATKATGGLGTAMTGLSSAIGPVTLAATIAFGAWEQHKQKQAEARAEVERITAAFAVEGATFESVTRDLILANEDLVESLSEMNVGVDEVIAANREGEASWGKYITQLGMTGEMSDDTFLRLVHLRDQLIDSSKATLESADAQGKLTGELAKRWAAFEDGAISEGELIDLSADYRESTDEAAEATSRHTDLLSDHIEKLKEAANKTDAFREAIDKLAGKGLSLVEARGALAEGMAEVQQIVQQALIDGTRPDDPILQANLGEFARTAQDAVISFFEAGQPRQAQQIFAFQRQALIDAYTEITGDPRTAEAFVNSIFPPLARIQRRVRSAAHDTIRTAQNAIAAAQEELRGDPDADRERELNRIVRDAQRTIRVAQETLSGVGAELEIPIVLRRNDRQIREQMDAIDRILKSRRDANAGGGNAIPGSRGFTGGIGGAGGGLNPDELNLDNITAWQEDVVIMVNNVRAKFEEMQTDVTSTVRELGRTLERSFGRTMNSMAEIGRKGATRTVNGITDILRQGTLKVTAIVTGYARALANALNPLLEAIGEAKITPAAPGANILTFAQGGFSPEMATNADGPQVHVFNEASSHGEAYIPFDPKHKGRARDIADKSARRLGGRIQWFAEGGITAPVANVTGDWQGLHPEFARRLSSWATALGDVYHVNSGFRTYAEQVDAWNRYQAGTGAQAAVPGTSMHEFGLAADGPHWGGRNPAAQRLVYPMDFEPWHVQPVEGKGLTGGGIMMPQIPHPPDAGEHGVLSRLAEAMMQWAYDKVLAFASSQSMTPPTLGTGVDVPGSVASWIREAMAATGVPSSWFNALVARAMQESSGNPRAINLTDSNARAGHPSMGLMQTIMSTFQAYALPGHGNIWNPVDNAIAAIRYIIARYGSVFNLPAGGYANGGVIRRKQMAWLGEDGPEVVLPLTRPARLQTLLAETGLDRLIAQSLLNPSRPDVEGHLRGSRSTPSRQIDMNLSFEGDLGSVDPALYSELAGAVRSGVADGISRAEALEERWS